MAKNKNKNSARNQRRKLRKKQNLEDQENLLSMENLYQESKVDPDTYAGQVRIDIPQMEKAIKDSKNLNKINEKQGWKSWLVSWIW